MTLYVISFFATYVQTRRWEAWRSVLFNLRNTLFTKLQELPLEFFNQNKAGDLISRINNDTDKLNQFFSQALVQFVGNLFMMAGAGVFLLSSISAWARRPGAGARAAAVHEGDVGVDSPQECPEPAGAGRPERRDPGEPEQLQGDRRVQPRDYFRERFDEANERNFRASVSAGLANTIFVPVYGLSSNLAQLIVLAYGV